MQRGCPFHNATNINKTDNRTEGEEEEEEKKETENTRDYDDNNNNIENDNDNDNDKPCYYHRYLCLDKILKANNARTHISQDEHLFITIHQTYELWFKEIIYELDLIIDIMKKMNKFDNENVYNVVLKINRINTIFEILNNQFKVLETMTSLDFLKFRELLGSASGFQSYQFRIIESKLGLKKEQRLVHNQKHYYECLEEPHTKMVQDVANNKETLLNVLIKWLELYYDGWRVSFWHEYEENVYKYIKDKNYDSLQDQFNVIFNENNWQQLLNNNKVQLSYKALQIALMITLYPNLNIFQIPNQLMNSIMELNKNLLNWRHAHVLLAHRIIGSKMGTSGTTGIHYLKSTSVHHQIFNDIVNLSTYIIPPNYLPSLSFMFVK